MKREKLVGLFAVTAAFLFAGCSGSVETGPVPTITPRPAVTLAPTPTPLVTETDQTDQPGETVETQTVYDTKKFKEYYETENKLPELDEAYKDLFTVGIDALQIDITDANRQAIIKEQFNTISVKSDLSPNYLMDYEASAASGDLTRISLDFSGADVILKFAQENNIPVRGPKLITNETPDWAFTKDFSEAQVVVTIAEDGTETATIEYASEDVIWARFENYIKDVIEYCNTNYPGVVVSWDVLDDVIAANQGQPQNYRTDSQWYQTLGDSYMVKACEFARKYATADQKLFFSQDGLDENAVQKSAMDLLAILKDAKVIDGVAIQAHYNPNGPNVFAMEGMFKTIAEAGYEMHITEFHVDSNEGNVGDGDLTKEELLARCAKRYKNLMTTISNTEIKTGYDIVNITFEGLTDDTSYLNEPKDYVDILTGEKLHGVQKISYPYLFDEELKVKDTFFAAMGDATIKGY